jgi:peptide deformylase
MIDIENCHITHIPAKVLAEPAKPVEKIDEPIRKLVDKMADIMVEYKGVGLAGPQAGVPLRIFIISLDGQKENVRAFINPTVVCDGKTVTNEEGCLSVPGVFTRIRRYKKCTVTATGLDGKVFTEEAEGLYARALQHEFDHINGTTIADKMSTVAKIAHRKKLQELKDRQENENQ